MNVITHNHQTGAGLPTCDCPSFVFPYHKLFNLSLPTLFVSAESLAEDFAYVNCSINERGRLKINIEAAFFL